MPVKLRLIILLSRNGMADYRACASPGALSGWSVTYECMGNKNMHTENIKFVFAAVKDTILQSNLREYNLV
ncbi:hypothetical protein NQ318_019278 [Aromia moschata]|uniref:Secreted protein n=1 Tax=Aromia moschata TaxID=1265417 RepID=A0AAV8YXI3_9CUCU|nr:hypothetical protein NQ318_019278 [Aromia moschata]